MTTEKVSATLDRKTLAAVRKHAGRRGVSAFLEAAALEKLEREEQRVRVRAYLKELEREDPITPAARAKAERLVREILGK